MEINCTTTQDWIAQTGVGMPEEVLENGAPYAAHATQCDACKTLLGQYGALIEQFQTACEYDVSKSAEKIFLEAARAQTSVTSSYTSLVDTLRSEQEEQPTRTAELAFLQAARAQAAEQEQVPATTIPLRQRLVKPALAAMAAAAAVVIFFSNSQTPQAQAPSQLASVKPPKVVVPQNQKSSKIAEGIAYAKHVGNVALNGVPLDAGGAQRIQVGTVITTATKSQIQLNDASNAAVMIKSESQVQVLSWNEKATQLKIDSGSVRASVVHRTPDELFEITTANARVIVVGTEFSVAYNQRGDTLVRGFEGKVRVERLDGTLVGFVTADQILRVASVSKKPLVAAKRIRKAKPQPQRMAVAEMPDEKPTPKLKLEPEKTPVVALSLNDALNQARIFLAEGQNGQAIEILGKQPYEDWRKDALLGDAYQLGGQHGQAIAAYGRVLSREKDAPPSLLADLARLQMSYGPNSDEAYETWQRYLDTYPQGADAPNAFIALGQRLLKAQRWDDAEQLFDSHTNNANSTMAETALVGMIRIRIAQGQQESGAQLIDSYKQRFPEGLRLKEVKRLESVLVFAGD